MKPGDVIIVENKAQIWSCASGRYLSVGDVFMVVYISDEYDLWLKYYECITKNGIEKLRDIYEENRVRDEMANAFYENG